MATTTAATPPQNRVSGSSCCISGLDGPPSFPRIWHHYKHHGAVWSTVPCCFYSHCTRYTFSFFATLWLVLYLVILVSRFARFAGYSDIGNVSASEGTPLAVSRLFLKHSLLVLVQFSIAHNESELKDMSLDVNLWIALTFWVELGSSQSLSAGVALPMPQAQIYSFVLTSVKVFLKGALALQLEYSMLRWAIYVAVPFSHSLFVGHDYNLQPHPSWADCSASHFDRPFTASSPSPLALVPSRTSMLTILSVVSL